MSMRTLRSLSRSEKYFPTFKIKWQKKEGLQKVVV